MKKLTSLKSVLLISSCFIAAFLLSKYPLSKMLENDAHENETEMLQAYYQQEFEKTVDPRLGYVPIERLKIATDQLRRQASNRAAVGLTWQERGPSNIGGRTRSVIFDKNDATNKKVWAGSVGGGIWTTNDITAASPVWTSVGDFLNNLAFTTIAQDNATPQYLYAGTGEGRSNADAIQGLGIFTSSNGGASWTQSPTTNNSNFYYVNKIVVDASGNVYAATWSGLYKSTDRGANWSPVLNTTTTPATATSAISDIEIAADGSIYAGTGNFSTGQIWKSAFATYGANTGNASNWANVSPAGSYRRVEIATAPSNSQVVYAMAHNGADNNCSSIFSSTDGGSSWTSNAAPTIYDQGSNSNFTRGQAWYDLILSVDPNVATTVYIGGVDILRSTNSAAAWTQITTWSSFNGGTAPTPWPRASVHADIHEIKFLTGSSTTALIGCDGGVFYSTDINGALATGVPSASKKVSSYNVTQYFAADNNPTACSNDVIAGAQDNGTQVMQSAGIGAGATVTGGDGMFCHIDQNNQNVQIASFTNNNYVFTNNYWTSGFSSASNSTGRFTNPTEFDDVNKILYACQGTSSYYDIKGGILNGSGSVLPTNTLHSGLTGTPSAFKVDPNNPNVLWVGSGGGSFNKVVNPASAAPTITAPVATSFFGGYISSIDVQKGNSNHILVTVSNYGVNQVLESTNGGTVFTAIDGNLPDMPVRWGIFNPLNADQIFLATELGVWSTDDINGASTVWAADNSGLANVRVDMIKYRESDYTIVAATHGRGVYTAKLSTPTPATNGNVVAEQQLESGQNSLGPNQTAYFYSKIDGQIICKIVNNSSFDYGCTTVNVTRASNVSLTPIHFYTITNANDLMPKTIQIVPTNNTASGNFTVTLYVTAAEIVAWQAHTGSIWSNAQFVNCSGNITLVTPSAKTAGGTVAFIPNTANSAVNLPFVSATLTSTMGGSYGIGTQSSYVLPIELLSFSGKEQDKSVVLNWQTATERQAKHFEVERSSDGDKFEKIGIVKAKGNSTTTTSYTLTDYKPMKGVNYYRLRQVDLGDDMVLSNVIAVDIFTVQKLQVFPNPAVNNLSIVSDFATKYTISDLSGREILRGVLNLNQTDLNVSNLPSGVYLLNTQRATVKFFKL